MSERNVLLIAGSRDMGDMHKHAVADLINTSRVNLANVTPMMFHVLLHGAARGVDSIAADWGHRRGLQVAEMPADWDRYGKRAGFVRNMQMVAEADAAIIIWNGRSSGTKHTIDLVQEKMIPHVLAVRP